MPEVIFHRYGDRYFLTEVRNWDGYTRKLSVSPEEKEAMRLQSPVQISILADNFRGEKANKQLSGKSAKARAARDEAERAPTGTNAQSDKWGRLSNQWSDKR